MPLPADWVTGNSFTAADANDLADSVVQLGLNVKDYGAVGDGATDDSAAFLAAYTEAAATTVSDALTPSPRGAVEIFIPPGTYLIESPEAMLGQTAASARRGLKFRGAGREAATVVFSPATPDEYLCFNDDEYLMLTFEDMSFYSTVATASFMRSDSYGSGNGYHVFNNVLWGGEWKYGFDLFGDNNNDHLTWRDCIMFGDWTSFLHVGAADTSDQFVMYNFFGTHNEVTSGDFIDMAKGGNINVYGGSFIHAGDADEAGSSAQCFFRLGGDTHAGGAQRLLVSGLRVEQRHENSQLINCEWGRGNISFVSCDTETSHFTMSNPENVVQAEFGGVAASYPEVVFDGCTLMGKHRYHFLTSTWQEDHRIEYRNCETVTFGEAKDFIDYVDDGASGNTSGKPALLFKNCRSLSGDYKETFDTTLNWHDSVSAVVSPKVLSIRMPYGGIPWGSTPESAYLPLNAIITRVRCFKEAGGASAATNVSYTLADATPTTIATATTGGSAWNTSWAYDSGLLRYVCSTDNKRKLTVTPVNGPAEFSTPQTYFLVEYLA